MKTLRNTLQNAELAKFGATAKRAHTLIAGQIEKLAQKHALDPADARALRDYCDALRTLTQVERAATEAAPPENPSEALIKALAGAANSESSQETPSESLVRALDGREHKRAHKAKR